MMYFKVFRRPTGGIEENHGSWPRTIPDMSPLLSKMLFFFVGWDLAPVRFLLQVP
jgi:hypothetical protein